MTRLIRDLRLIPIALMASTCLLVLKMADLALDGGRRFAASHGTPRDGATAVIRTSPDAPLAAGEKLSWAQQMFNFPGGTGAAPSGDIAPSLGARANAGRPNADRASAERGKADITGSIATTPTAPAAPAAGTSGAAGAKPDPVAAKEVNKNGKSGPPPPTVDGTLIPTDGAALPSGAERAILERLQQRREELDARARELDIRESLLKAAEKRIDAHLTEIKEVEARIKVETVEKDQAEAARFKGLVTMYENMKPRDAAKIFDRLDMEVLIKVASQINPRAMAEILPQMSADAAERLTVELASKAQGTAKNDPAELPKIEGKPTQP